MRYASLLGLLIGLVACLATKLWAAPSAVRVRYLVLTTENRTPPPFRSVDIVIGPKVAEGQWWQLEVRSGTRQEEPPRFQWRVLTAVSPLRLETGDHRFLRYQLQFPATGATLGYRDVHTGQALVPGWSNVQEDFVPRKACSSRLAGGVPETLEYLGHVLTLTWTGPAEWRAWPAVKTLALDPECLVGTGRNFKDAEGHRLAQQPKRQDYTYVEFTAADYRVMIDAGFNLFTVKPHQEACGRDRPVFYLRQPAAKPPIDYPADLYRANYLGQVMFMDEPSSLMVGDPNIHDTLRYFSDAATLITRRTHAHRPSGTTLSGVSLRRRSLLRRPSTSGRPSRACPWGG